jgi:hypothetical protein
MHVVIFHASSHERDLARLLSARLNGSADETRSMSTPVASPKYRSLRPLLRPVRKIWSRARGLAPLSLAPLSYVAAFSRCGYRRMRAHGIVKKSAADVIVLFEDNIGNFTRFIGAAAARMNVPYVVLPTTIPNPREAAGFFRSSKAHAASGWPARLVARRWPQWVYDFDGHRMLRLPAADIIAMRALGVDNAKPWVLNSGQASAVCAESTANRQIYERLGVEARQIATIGNLADDVLFDASRDREKRRAALAAELGLDPDRTLLAVAFPPDQFGAPSTQGFEYGSFAELVDGWLRALAPLARRVNVVLRAHPRLDPAKLEPFEAAGCHIFRGATEELVALADVFAASISATIRWALALGIPVVNYDCYRYRYHDYRSAKGMTLVEDQRAFACALRELSLDPAARRQPRDEASADSINWGCVDGQFTTRFLALLRRLSRAPVEPFSAMTCPLPH